ncbi:unnamed protein product [Scytosiphon promiscuus]
MAGLEGIRSDTNPDVVAGVEASDVGAGPTAATAEVHLPAAQEAVNQTGAVQAAQEHVVYNCRMCRRAVFNAADIESHEPAQHNFHRRKSKGVTSKGVCSSIFLAEPKRWMKQQLGELEGKLSCPNKSCGARLGSLKWTGAQCSCGSWITPAIQFPRKNLDARSRVAAGPPPGTVLHPSLRDPGSATPVASDAPSSVDSTTTASAIPSSGGDLASGGLGGGDGDGDVDGSEARAGATDEGESITGSSSSR